VIEEASMGSRIGPLYVRRSAYIAAPPARVWREFESFERICAWFDRGHRIHALEPRVGGLVDMSVEIDGVHQRFGGQVLVCEPGRELTFEENWQGPLAWPTPMLMTIRLTPLYEGTVVEIFHHGFERLGAAAGDEFEGYEAGWDNKHLVALRRIIEGSAERRP
jgi:uncharacterized protein YndB with AHSA1/START domain